MSKDTNGGDYPSPSISQTLTMFEYIKSQQKNTSSSSSSSSYSSSSSSTPSNNSSITPNKFGLSKVVKIQDTDGHLWLVIDSNSTENSDVIFGITDFSKVTHLTIHTSQSNNYTDSSYVFKLCPNIISVEIVCSPFHCSPYKLMEQLQKLPLQVVTVRNCSDDFFLSAFLKNINKDQLTHLFLGNNFPSGNMSSDMMMAAKLCNNVKKVVGSSDKLQFIDLSNNNISESHAVGLVEDIMTFRPNVNVKINLNILMSNIGVHMGLMDGTERTTKALASRKVALDKHMGSAFKILNSNLVSDLVNLVSQYMDFPTNEYFASLVYPTGAYLQDTDLIGDNSSVSITEEKGNF
ncbi:MAG: hypothetical protein J0L79_03745 [Rickettsiales bacterium]|nr:hypothetical protein [Rickettsiales bacterium]MCA0254145.1 hypothetical protein [Pseudomonadota bacterium]